MADFRKAKYSGSLNLAPECGPVHIELDSVAKTATASLEDPASQYTLAGGGGGLDYVIPEQTVTSNDEYAADLANVDVSGLTNGDYAIVKISDKYAAGVYNTTPSEMFEFKIDEDTFSVVLMGDTWKLLTPASQTTYTISAIRGF